MPGETFMGLLAPNLRARWRLLEGHLRIPGQADHVLQEALLHEFARRHQFRLRSKFKSWLWTIVLNEMRMFFRVEATDDLRSKSFQLRRTMCASGTGKKTDIYFVEE
jgi:DNA-directed RNA polymerase specialized sigma24 family protein